MSKSRQKPGKQRRSDSQRPAQGRPQSGRARKVPEKDPRRSEAIKPSTKGTYFLHGRNSVEAALKNPARECIRLIVTEKSANDPQISKLLKKVKAETLQNADLISNTVPDGTPHQGVLLEVRPLPGQHLDELSPKPNQKNIILMLDQVTDPHNVGACMRSAAAFGARAIITQDRNSPMETGTLARSAAGGLETLPWLRVANLSDALGKLRDMGYWHVGLDGGTDLSIRDLSLGDNIVIVMGSEGSGLRPLVKKNCDAVAKIPMTGSVESLNVSNAAAIALYELGGL
jgi:23S rRNA (guanosine2251-2'-O)-methyltransferase